MVELATKNPCDGLLPVVSGSHKLEQADLGPLTSVAPFAGQKKHISDALKKACGVSYPDPNGVEQTDDVRAIWMSHDSALLAGVEVDWSLQSHAALTDQSDAWAAVFLSGKSIDDVLARLVPVDLRLEVFQIGQTRRTLLGHMNVSVSRVADNRVLILVFRSMAGTLVEELQEAMEDLAKRG